MYSSPNHPIADTCRWFVATGQMPPVPTLDHKQSAFYLGMQCEELAEKLEVLFGEGHTVVCELHRLADAFKKGTGDPLMASVLARPENALKMLDADMDLLWVSIGAARAQGADVIGAYDAVTRANWDKAVDGEFKINPENRKVMKREGWQPPDLRPFIRGSAS